MTYQEIQYQDLNMLQYVDDKKLKVLCWMPHCY